MNAPMREYTWSELEARAPKGNGSTFEHDGMVWTKFVHAVRSNSGKFKRWSISFKSDQGHYVPDDMPPNRRNDPDRNWGLGRE